MPDYDESQKDTYTSCNQCNEMCERGQEIDWDASTCNECIDEMEGGE